MSQRIINIKIAKAYRTTSNEALCALTGITPIVIKAEEEGKIFIMRGSNQNEIDKDEKARDWLRPAELVRIIETPEEEEIQIYTDGSKKRKWYRRGYSYLCQRENRGKTKYKLHDNCSNNQAKQLAIVKAMETLENTNIRNSRRRIVTIYTDSKVTIQSIKNYRNHKRLIEKIRKKH